LEGVIRSSYRMRTNPTLSELPPSIETAVAAPPQGVSVVVVSFNTREKLRRCLQAIPNDYQVIVVDNASIDGSAEMVETDFPHVELLRNKVNEGFGAANNRGCAHVKQPLTLFLNSDCYAHPGSIDILARHMNHESVIACGGRLLNPDASLQNSASNMLNLWHVVCEQLYLEPLVRSYWTTPGKNHRRIMRVGQVMGACLMIRSGSVLFDERFFLYCEDTDLLYRLNRAQNGVILYVPQAEFTHELGASSEGAGRWVSVARYNRGKELFFRSHFGLIQATCCWLINRFGALLRLAIWSAANILTLFQVQRWRDRIPLWGSVLTAPLAGPPRPDRRRS